MVVSEYHRCRANPERVAQDFARIDGASVYSSCEKVLDPKYPMPVVEPDCVKFFMLKISKPCAKEVCGCLWVCEPTEAFEPAKKDAFGEAKDVGFSLRPTEVVVA
ncbi:hypothetical protein SAMN05216289_11348 [Dokdonella immobilis]|uniref:Uncharacterized protein n=1 Tax=Dokdonella immobilis TaxID=578942 RepID=A0A1I4XYE2_9GAMM|nr:hypothetical protein SAMN05216289_11348 [Dokdonella immobilis]